MNRLIKYLIANLITIIEYGLGITFLSVLFFKNTNYNIIVNYSFVFFLGLYFGIKLIIYSYKRNDFLISKEIKRLKRNKDKK